MRKIISSLLVAISTIITAQNPNTLADSFTLLNRGITTTLESPYMQSLVGDPTITPTEGYRRIIWVHGLTGDKNSWINAGSAVQDQKNIPEFQARKVRSEYPEYGEQGTASAAASQLHGQILNYCSIQEQDDDFGPCNQNFLIGHSQGGIVSRSLLYNHFCLNESPFDELGFGGLVTVNSPHLGAMILNNRALADKMLSKLCYALSIGPLTEKSYDLINQFNLPLWIFDGATGWYIDKIVNAAGNTICEDLENALFYQLSSSAMPPITNDYQVGADWINALNMGCENEGIKEQVRKLVFYGIENDMLKDPETGEYLETEGLIFRVLWYLITSPNHPIYHYFGANEDEKLFGKVQTVLNPYVAKIEEYETKVEDFELKLTANHCNDLGYFLNPLAPFVCHFLNAKRKEAKKILDAYKLSFYWANTVDEDYKHYIGAVTYEKEMGCNCYAMDDEYGNSDEPFFNGPMDYENTSYDACEDIPKLRECDEEFLKIHRIYEHNDGIVLESSQKGMKDLIYSPILLPNTSHMQARNNEALKSALKKLLDGEYGEYFMTAKK